MLLIGTEAKLLDMGMLVGMDGKEVWTIPTKKLVLEKHTIKGVSGS